MGKEKISQIITLLIWIAGIVLWSVKGWWYIPAAILVLHLVEVFVIGIDTGRENGKSIPRSIVMTVIFGISWWMPLRENNE